MTHQNQHGKPIGLCIKTVLKTLKNYNNFKIVFVNEKRPYIRYNKKEKKIVKKNTTINENDYIHLSGETAFNFKQMHYKRYKKFLEENDDYVLKLHLCKQSTYTPANISLLPQTGDLQNVKKGIGSDRLDTFVWALNAYYSNDVCLLLNHSTQENISRLKSYLSSYKDVYLVIILYVNFEISFFTDAFIILYILFVKCAIIIYILFF